MKRNNEVTCAPIFSIHMSGTEHPSPEEEQVETITVGGNDGGNNRYDFRSVNEVVVQIRSNGGRTVASILGLEQTLSHESPDKTRAVRELLRFIRRKYEGLGDGEDGIVVSDEEEDYVLHIFKRDAE